MGGTRERNALTTGCETLDIFCDVAPLAPYRSNGSCCSFLIANDNYANFHGERRLQHVDYSKLEVLLLEMPPMKSTIAFLLSLLFVTLTHGQEWKPLFDGQSFDGWTKADGTAVDVETTPAWEAANGMLHLDRTKGKGGNLLTDREYGNFEMLFEWKVAPGANNGIKYRVRDFDGRVLGLEYQVIDDFGKPKLTANHKTASIYDIYDAKEHDVLRPADEWNRGRIVVQNNRIEHWLNGSLISEAEVGSEDWNEHLAKSKFADIPGFGVNTFGHIMLTDHNDEVWYRNLFIRELTISNPATQIATAPACIPPMQVKSSCCCQPSQRRPARQRIGLFRRMRR